MLYYIFVLFFVLFSWRLQHGSQASCGVPPARRLEFTLATPRWRTARENQGTTHRQRKYTDAYSAWRVGNLTTFMNRRRFTTDELYCYTHIIIINKIWQFVFLSHEKLTPCRMAPHRYIYKYLYINI